MKQFWMILAVMGLVACTKQRQPTATTEAGSSANAASPQTVTIVINPAYDPGIVEVPANVPVDLVFDKRTDSTCTEDVIFEGLNKTQHLTPLQKTTVHFDELPPGEYLFHCGMNMIFGKLVVKTH